ncbi:unnamed protein product [Tuwongella immobilis]|uniref:Uncharacterized protein n=1 Tax=Tuwongella immobilis TaxID=692036 RepID=A0A6C2YVX2_9BACT|nr:unnamed protein product [Tuwongella immobilis]VTS07382.1 unnamed protein product [Tuwongella immobilis]
MATEVRGLKRCNSRNFSDRVARIIATWTQDTLN